MKPRIGTSWTPDRENLWFNRSRDRRVVGRALLDASAQGNKAAIDFIQRRVYPPAADIKTQVEQATDITFTSEETPMVADALCTFAQDKPGISQRQVNRALAVVQALKVVAPNELDHIVIV